VAEPSSEIPVTFKIEPAFLGVAMLAFGVELLMLEQSPQGTSTRRQLHSQTGRKISKHVVVARRRLFPAEFTSSACFTSGPTLYLQFRVPELG